MLETLAARLIAGGVAALIFTGAAGAAYWSIYHKGAASQKPKVEAAQAQAQTSETTTKALDHYTERTVVIREKANAAVRIVQAAPGADAPIPDAVRAAWIDGLRHDDPSASDDPDPAKPEGAVRKTRP